MNKNKKNFDDDHFFDNNEMIVIQKDTSNPINYDQNYFDHYIKLEMTLMGKKITQERIKLVRKFSKDTILDIGIGSGSFIKNTKLQIYGYDINPIAVKWLEKNSLFLNPYKDDTGHIKCWTFWDVLEHIPNPKNILEIIKPTDFVFLSIPIFDNFLNLKKSKHFKPNEHFFYFTNDGLISFMKKMKFYILHTDNTETKLGRENIKRYVFQKNA